MNKLTTTEMVTAWAITMNIMVSIALMIIICVILTLRTKEPYKSDTLHINMMGFEDRTEGKQVLLVAMLLLLIVNIAIGIFDIHLFKQ